LLRLTRLDSLRYFKRPTGSLAGTKREFLRNAVLAPGLYGFKQQRYVNSLPRNNYHNKWW